MIEAHGASSVVVPGSSFILTATYTRQGDDLLLTGEGGRTVLIRDFFAGDTPPDLMTDAGARVTGGTAALLAGPLAPGQVAQAGGQLAQQAPLIGRVEVVDGQATATRTDGTVVTLTQGSQVFQGDVVQTGGGSKLGLVFIDKTTFSMGDNARMVLNELVYNPQGGQQSSVVTVLQGLFVFVTGEVGKLSPESVTINTPVATIGIRGTKGVIAEFSQVGGDLKIGCVTGTMFGQTNVGNPVDIPAGTSTSVSSLNLPPLPAQPDPAFLNAPSTQDVNSISQSLDTFSVDPGRRENYGTGQNNQGGQENDNQGGQAPSDSEAQEAANTQPGAGGDGEATNDPKVATDSINNAAASENETDKLDNTGPIGAGSAAGNDDSERGGTGSGLPAAGTAGGTGAGGTEGGETAGEQDNGASGDEQLQLIATNTAPVVDLNGADEAGSDNTETYTVGGAATALTDVDLVVNDPDGTTLQSATVTITNLLDAPNEVLTASTAGTSITSSYDSTTGVLSLSGTDSAAAYQQVLQSVTYSNTAATPNTTSRTIAVAVNDGTATSTATSTIVFNQSPIATADVFATGENTALNQGAAGGLLSNDRDPDGDAFTITSVDSSAPAGQGGALVDGSGAPVAATAPGTPLALANGGTVTVQADGSFVFNPGTDFDFLAVGKSAATTFQYTIADPFGATSTATATITVAGVNDTPTGVADSFKTGENTALNITPTGVLANDTDPDAGTSLIVSKVNGSASNVGTPVNLAGGGTVTMQADGTFTFNPGTAFDFLPQGKTAVTSFTYTASDQAGGQTKPTTVNITVNGVNDAPTVSTGAGQAGAGTANILFVSDSGAGFGIADVLEADGHNVTRAIDDFVNGSNPALLGNLSGFDAIFWSASGDRFGNLHTDLNVFANLTTFVQNGGKVFVTGYDSIASPNDPSLYTFLGGTGSQDFGDVGGPITGQNSLTNGLFDITGITPTGFFFDTDTIFPDASVGTITVVPSTFAGGASWTIRTLGLGEIAYVSNGTSDPNASVPSWTNTSASGDGVYNAAIRNFALNSASGFSTAEDTPLTINSLSVSDVDAGNTPLTTWLSVNNGSLALNSVTGLTLIDGDGSDGTLAFSGTLSALNAALGTGVVYTPDADFNGGDTISVMANDGLADSPQATAQINVTAVNDAPVAVDDQYQTDENTVLNIPAPGVLGNDTDADGDPLSLVQFSQNLIFGVDSGRDSLYTIDVATGNINIIGPLSPDPARFTTPISMAVRPSDGAIFVNNNSPAGDDSLAVIDATTGLATSLGGGAFIDACLAFDQNDNLYTISGGQLFRVSQTDGSGTLIGGSAIPRIGGLDFNPADGLLYAGTLSNAMLLKIDPTNGVIVDSVQMSFNGSTNFLTQSLLFDPSGSLLLTDGSFLYDVDVSTGALSNQRLGGSQGLGLVATNNSMLAGDNGGTFSIQPDGSFTFDPGNDFDFLNPGEQAVTSVIYTIHDPSGAQSTATLNVTVNGTLNGPMVDLDANDSSGQANGDYAASYTSGGVPIAIADTDVLISDFDSQILSQATITLTNPSTVLEFEGTVISTNANASDDIAPGNTFRVRIELDPNTPDDGGLPTGAQYTGSVRSVTIFIPETGQTFISIPAGTNITRVFNDVSGGQGLLTDQVFVFGNNVSGSTILGEAVNLLQVSFFDFESSPTAPGMLSDQSLLTQVPLHDNDGPPDANLFAFTLASGAVATVNLGPLTVVGGGEGLQVAGPLPGGIVATTNSIDQIVLSGNASLADYQAAIQQIQYVSNAVVPSGPTKTIEVTATDETGRVSNIATSSINTVTTTDGADNVVGSPGNDVLGGGLGDDSVSALAGDDLMYRNTGDGNDTYSGGSGFDTLWINGTDTGVPGVGNDWRLQKGGPELQLFQTNVALTLATVNIVQTESLMFWGSSFNDSLRLVGDYTGTFLSNNTIGFDGGDGDDSLDGPDADRRIVADGGAGNDTLRSGVSDDTLNGGSGADLLFGGDGLDQLFGDAGEDVLFGDAGNDALDGGTGDDVLIGGAGDDALDGNAGNDDAAVYLWSDAGVTASLATGIATGEGTDQLTRIENLLGSNYDDTLTGDAGGNELWGGAGDDRLQGGLGDDFLYGGPGFDIALFTDATGGILVDVLNGVVTGLGVGTDQLIQFEKIVGGAFADTFIDAPEGPGTAMSGFVHEFEPRQGDDTVLGIGPTRVGYFGAKNGVAVDLENQSGTDIGGNSVGHDTYQNVSRAKLSDFDDMFWSSNYGFNEVMPLGGNDTITGQGAQVRVSYATAPDSVDLDLASGVVSNDGYGFIDTVTNVQHARGSDNAGDILRGDAGDNELYGLGGNDILIGRGGSDLLDGGSEVDLASYSGAGGPISVDMTAGTVVLGGSTDWLVSIERINGTAFNDTYLGGTTPGADTPVDRFRGGAGDDVITPGARTILDYGDASGTGVTVNTAGSVIDVSAAGLGTDSLVGNNQVYGVYGSDFDDTLIGNDRSAGGIRGGNRLRGNDGNDILNGAGGDADEGDYFNSPDRIYVNLSDNDVAAGNGVPAVAAHTALDGFGGTDSLISIENIRGSIFDDWMLGSSQDSNTFSGKQGNDFMDGGIDSFGNTVDYSGNVSSPFSSTPAAPVDLSSWLVDGGGNWTLQTQQIPNDSAFQSLNSPPTVLFNNTDSQGQLLTGTVEVQTTGDDDFFGFVLGYDDNDLTGANATTDFILIDWKQGTQAGWDAGLAISRVTGSIAAGGTDTTADAWQHVGNVTFLERAATLGNVGWQDNTEYLFEIVFTPTLIEVSVDGVQQFSINGTFEDGSFGFYNFSQQSVRYAGIAQNFAPVPAQSTQGIVADLSAGWVIDNFGFTDTIVNIQNVIGSELDDVIRGDSNANVLNSLAGADWLAGGASFDTLIGGNDIDTADYQTATAGIFADLSAGFVTGDASVGTDTLTQVEGVNGTDFNDTYNTTDNVAGNGAQGLFNWFQGNAGDDTIIGNGQTVIDFRDATAGVTVTFTQGDAGTATGNASVGTDVFSGVNAVYGSANADQFTGADGDEILMGRSGADWLDGGTGTDEASYADSLVGVDADLAAGTADDGYGFTDTLMNIDNLRGSGHSDELHGDGFANTIWGGAGDDLLEGRAGDDSLFGEEGNDLFVGGAGNDAYDGGPGADGVDYHDETAAVSVSLAAGTATGNSIGTDSLLNMEHAWGTDFDDTLIGDAGVNVLIGGDGDDLIIGGGGSDYIGLGAGNDRVRFNALADGIQILAGQTPGPSRTGDNLRDYTPGEDTIEFGRAIFGGAQIVQGTNYAVIGTKFDGTVNTVTQADATAFGNDQATLIYSTADNTLSFAPNGAASASYTLFATVQDPTAGAPADTDLQSL